MRQYFYLVAYRYDECTVPRKIFLQEHEAIQWGRREATKKFLETKDTNYEYVLYKQEITRTGELQYVETLHPYPTEAMIINAKLITPPENKRLGADCDIDAKRL